MDREGGNKEKMRKSKEWVSLHFFILPPFPHSLFIFSFSFHFLTARLPGCRKFCNPGTICKVSRKVSQGHSDKTNQQSRTRLNPLKSGRNPVWKGAPGVLFTLFLMFWWSGFLCERNSEMPNKPQDALWQIRGAHTDDPVWEGGINVHICIYHPSAHPFSSQRNTTRYQICGTIELHRDLISKVLSEW